MHYWRSQSSEVLNHPRNDGVYTILISANKVLVYRRCSYVDCRTAMHILLPHRKTTGASYQTSTHCHQQSNSTSASLLYSLSVLYADANWLHGIVCRVIADWLRHLSPTPIPLAELTIGLQWDMAGVNYLNELLTLSMHVRGLQYM